MKPPARQEVSQGGKQGKVFPEIIRGTLFPSNSCCPNKEEIWVKLTYKGEKKCNQLIYMNNDGERFIEYIYFIHVLYRH